MTPDQLARIGESVKRVESVTILGVRYIPAPVADCGAVVQWGGAPNIWCNRTDGHDGPHRAEQDVAGTLVHLDWT